ncbi:MAG: hydroxyacid dehydrogenase [Azospirillum brasilense]|nr:MAG: hydroxyacid dehydrogenase [Azospirillum brasilense]
MTTAHAFAAYDATSPLKPWSFERRAVGARDVAISIDYCGVCHSDIHQARNEWGGSAYPMVPGHEIVGHVTAVGAEVTKFKVGDAVGVGCIVDSCRTCDACTDDLEQYCENGFSGTYNSTEQDKKTPTYGGYSDHIVVAQEFVLKVPENLPLDAAAPLLCAGVTTWSPLKHWNVGKGQKVGIVGLGGLGHMGVKFAAALGAETYIITTSPGKIADAKQLGAVGGVVSTDAASMAEHAGSFDFILSTISAQYDIGMYLNLLKRDGKMVVVGAPDKPSDIMTFSLIMGRKTLAGSLIGGIKETQEMLDFCGTHNITSDVEVIPVQQINEAYARMMKSDVRYRFVLDMKTLAA